MGRIIEFDMLYESLCVIVVVMKTLHNACTSMKVRGRERERGEKISVFGDMYISGYPNAVQRREKRESGKTTNFNCERERWYASGSVCHLSHNINRTCSSLCYAEKKKWYLEELWWVVRVANTHVFRCIQKIEEEKKPCSVKELTYVGVSIDMENILYFWWRWVEFY